MNKPNIILIQVDQWRADCLSSSGHPVVQTPFLDQLATRGVVFDKAYVSTPTCIASRASLMTGLGQKNHGRVGYEDGREWNYPITLAGEFTKNGYQTQAIGKMHVYPERNRIGFENVVLHDGFLHFARSKQRYDLVDDYIPWLREKTNYTSDYFDHGVSCNSYVARPWDKEEHLHPTNYVTSESIEFLRKRDVTKPFFLYVSYHRPHPPYDPPAWAFNQYLNEEMPEPLIGDWVEKFSYLRQPFNPIAIYDQISPRVLRRAKAGYYGHMTHIDHQINRLVESLKDYNAQDSYIMFISDHGELMGDHNFFRKSFPFEGSARIPLMLVGPNDSESLKPIRSNALIEMKDIMPTLLDCAGISRPNSIDGTSFLTQAKGESLEVNNYIHGEHVIGATSSVHWIRTPQYKYIWVSGNGIELFFDLENDPSELRDLSGNSNLKNKIKEHKEMLIKELSGRKDNFLKNGKLAVGGKVLKYIGS